VPVGVKALDRKHALPAKVHASQAVGLITRLSRPATPVAPGTAPVGVKLHACQAVDGASYATRLVESL
jgi:hypothetical protein